LLKASVYDLSAVDAAGRAQYELAAAHSGYALEIVEESLGAESPSTAERLVSHARALIDIDRPKRALKLAKQALRILNEQTPDDKEGIADVYHCAGLCFHSLHRFDDAERCIIRALRIYKEDGGVDLGYVLMGHDFVALKADKAEFYDSGPLYEEAYKLACKVLRVSERPEFENRIAMKQILSTSAELAEYLGLTSDQRIYLRKIELLNKKSKAA
jgi:tetratricopeptide (TPR) repeat protein